MAIEYPSLERLKKLPRWALRYINDLQKETIAARKDRDSLVAMFPWALPGQDWCTVFSPPHRPDREITVFTCDESGTKPLLTLGRRDYLFVGRSKERDL